MTITTKIVNGKLSRHIDDKAVGSSKAMDAAAEIRQGKPVTVVAYGNRHKVRVPNLTINTWHSRYNGASFNVKLSVDGERQLIFSTNQNQRAKEIIASIENLYFAGADLIQVDTAGNVTVTENAINLHVIETRPDKNGVTMSFVDGKRADSNVVYRAVTENHRALICNEFARLGISAAAQTEQEKYGCTGTFAKIELRDDFVGGWNEFSFETADEAIDAAQKIKAVFGKKFRSATICNQKGLYSSTELLAEIKPDTDERDESDNLERIQWSYEEIKGYVDEYVADGMSPEEAEEAVTQELLDGMIQASARGGANVDKISHWYANTVTENAPDTAESKAVTEKLPTGTITVESGAKAFELVAKYFPNGLKFDTLTAWYNGEEQFNFTDGKDMFLRATCDRDNTRIESLEVIDTNEDGSKRKPLFVVINQPAFSEEDAADYAITAEAQDVAVDAEIQAATENQTMTDPLAELDTDEYSVSKKAFNTAVKAEIHNAYKAAGLSDNVPKFLDARVSVKHRLNSLGRHMWFDSWGIISKKQVVAVLGSYGLTPEEYIAAEAEWEKYDNERFEAYMKMRDAKTKSDDKPATEVDAAESQSTNAVPVPKKKGDMTLDEWLDILVAEREIKNAVDEYAITAEAQDVAIDAEVELANTTNETGKQLPEIKPEFKRFGSFKSKAVAIDAKLAVATVKPALETLQEEFANLRYEIEEKIDDYRNECQDSWVYDGDINDYRGRPTDDFYRYVWDGETFASKYGMVFTLDEDGCFSRDPQTFKTLTEIEKSIRELQRRRHEVGKQIAKLQNATRDKKPVTDFKIDAYGNRELEYNILFADSELTFDAAKIYADQIRDALNADNSCNVTIQDNQIVITGNAGGDIKRFLQIVREMLKHGCYFESDRIIDESGNCLQQEVSGDEWAYLESLCPKTDFDIMRDHLLKARDNAFANLEAAEKFLRIVKIWMASDENIAVAEADVQRARDAYEAAEADIAKLYQLKAAAEVGVSA